jgi:hypothetical protein
MDLNLLCFLMGCPFFRMCKALMPGDEESMSDEAIWETLPVSYLVLMDLSVETFLFYHSSTFYC